GGGLAVPEDDVALEARRGRLARHEFGPPLLGLVVLLQRIERHREAVAHPRVGGGRQARLLQTPERLEGARAVAEAQRGPAAPEDGPRSEGGGFPIGRGLAGKADRPPQAAPAGVGTREARP